MEIGLCGEHIQDLYTVYFDQIREPKNCFTTRSLRQINTCRQALYWSIFKKSRHLGFGVFIVIWSMV
jgi:hypothetical protein